jgi:cell division protease FtsH
MKRFPRAAFVYVAVGLVVLFLGAQLLRPGSDRKDLTFSQLQQHIEDGEVSSATIKDQDHVVEGELRDGSKYRAEFPAEYADELVDQLSDAHPPIDIDTDQQTDSVWTSLLFSVLPMVLVLGAFLLVLNLIQGGGGRGVMQFGKSRAKQVSKDQPSVTFADVAGCDEAVEELQEIKEFLQDPGRFQAIGARIPKGVLLYGPPGTGKTLLARAVAGEAGVPFFAISGSDFVEMFVGVGASRVRDLFEQGKKNAPCIIFIDEIDAVGRHRGAGLGGGHDEREQTLNQLLVEMDGFESNEGVILIAATNRPDVLDPALQRPGRFDRRIVVPRPDLNGRIGVLQVHTKRVPLSSEVDLEVIARGTPGMTGADLENLVNEAALFAARQNKERVDNTDFESAKDKVFMGPERKSMIMTEKEKRNTAVHEAGHALVAKLLPGCDPVHKVTIIPRGQALGVTWSLPTEDKFNLYRGATLDQICMAMGGRIAEELVFNEMSSGAANDIERATETARAMVCRWGMSSKLGPLSFGSREGEVFLGRDFTSRPDYSEDTARQIDSEVREIVLGCYDRAKRVLTANFETLKRIADALMEYETLEADDVEILVNGGTITRERPKPRVQPPKPKEKEKRRILEGIQPLPALEPNKA